MRILRIIPVFLLLSGTLFAQEKQVMPKLPVDPDSKLIQYREVVDQQGNKDILYDRGSEWLRTYYLSPSSVTKVQDKVNGKIEGTGRLKISFVDETGLTRDAGIIFYDIHIEFKENKYRYTLNNFTLKGTSRYPIEKWMNKEDPAYNSRWDSYLYQVDTTMQGLVKSLKKGMQPKVIKKDEW
ncbi:MAG: DUF4468 domain-containing protein [Bacteroidota bacterium]|nr:DUF4468 domain-containing protein [Bacteroidota bacterium]